MAKNVIQSATLATFNSASLTASYQAVNSSGLPAGCLLVRIVNAATTAITISYDGTTDHEFVGANSFVQLDLQSNSQPNGFVANMKKGTVIYVKGTAGVGTIGVSAYYQST